MKELDFLSQEIFRRYGAVTRARGPFLYTEKNIRLTDLYQENGRAILGWGGGSAFTILKNTLNRGTTGSYKTNFSNRLQKSISALLKSERKIYTFLDKKSAMELALNISPEGTSVYKPWADLNIDWSKIKSVIVEPPLPWTAGLYILAVKDDLDMEVKLSHLQNSFFSVPLPAPIEAGATRAIYNLIQALNEREEKDWFIYDQALISYWERKGPYLHLRKDVIRLENFPQFLCHCLDCGIVINPLYGGTSLVPYGADKGVFSKFMKKTFSLTDN